MHWQEYGQHALFDIPYFYSSQGISDPKHQAQLGINYLTVQHVNIY